ncbi:uncharacterized protein LOC132543009 [Ylistrum balloti]|uniref:uncharacterized protein LOC132543009 n=1 Tax=Ylistrum balloti TaxID=509963 RepID=UPI002905E757|nr:uncharacterized protein LOC132543009 [Ylistrum balloti]
MSQRPIKTARSYGVKRLLKRLINTARSYGVKRLSKRLINTARSYGVKRMSKRLINTVRLGVAGIHVGVILQGSMLYCTWKGDVTDGGYTAILQSTTSDSDISDAERDAVTLEFPPMTCDGDGDVNRGDNSQTSEQDLGDSYAAVPSPSTSVMYNTGQKQLFRYTYCDSPADTSSEQDLEWDFECPVASKVKTPIPSPLKVTQMNKGSLKSLSSLESNSGYEKVVDWFKRAQDSDCMLYGSNETNSSYSYTS